MFPDIFICSCNTFKGHKRKKERNLTNELKQKIVVDGTLKTFLKETDENDCGRWLPLLLCILCILCILKSKACQLCQTFRQSLKDKFSILTKLSCEVPKK